MAIQSNTLWICDARDTLLQSRGGSVRCAVAYTCHGWRKPNAVAPALGFNGQRAEPLTEWYYLGHGHRVYNPTLMRFHSPDRLSPFEKGGLNTYVYCLGDPVNNDDPTGQSIARFAGLIDVAANFASHAENISASLFQLRPKGVLGYAALASETGYVSIGTGTALGLAGYSAASEVMATVGLALVSLGNGIRAAHGALRALKRSRVAPIVRRRLRIPSVSEDLLSNVVVVPSRGVLYSNPGFSTSQGVGSLSTPTKISPLEKSHKLRHLI